jgi:hypothetical protein
VGSWTHTIVSANFIQNQIARNLRARGLNPIWPHGNTRSPTKQTEGTQDPCLLAVRSDIGADRFRKKNNRMSDNNTDKIERRSNILCGQRACPRHYVRHSVQTISRPSCVSRRSTSSPLLIRNNPNLYTKYNYTWCLARNFLHLPYLLCCRWIGQYAMRTETARNTGPILKRTNFAKIRADESVGFNIRYRRGPGYASRYAINWC